MNKEELEYLRSWDTLKETIYLKRYYLTPDLIYNMCFNWGKTINIARSPSIRKLYTEYFTYFENFKIEEYDFKVRWYSLEDIVEFDIPRGRIDDLKILAAVCRGILWEILVFKTNIPCKICDEDLRSLIDKENKLYLCCDKCNYAEFINGEPIQEIERQLFPITPGIQTLYQLKPSNVI
ncbi:hypothetical protein [Paraflavitalea pollutisoli]|uniref:hypothetical protein n=1 Tax=Paraflavitalea pollutisoli TaxID=3034143 RepID=UPI0023EC2862|nr:hypothetical protein [Paraflavitalea sp. H1-2-19X]